MSKRKPSWVRTKIPKDTKIKLWRIVKDNPTFDAQCKYIANHPDIFGEEEERFVPRSRDSFTALNDEIMEMPIEEVCSLPSDLQIWIRDLRPELTEQLKERAKQSVISSDAKELREKLDHFDDLLYLIEQLEEKFREPTPKPTSIIDPNSFRYSLSNGAIIREIWIERDPLFYGLKEHINRKELWEGLQEWKKLGGSYIQESLNLLKDIRKEAELKTTEMLEEGLNATFWTRIYEQVILEQDSSATQLNGYRLKHLRETEFEIRDDMLIVKRENIIAAEGKPSQLELLPKIYKELVSKSIFSERAKYIWELWAKIRELENSLYEMLHSITLKKELSGTCQMCPGLRELSSEIQTIRQVRGRIRRKTSILEI